MVELHDDLLRLNDLEQEAMDGLLDAMRIIVEDFKLKNNRGELTAAVHVIQGFIIQHMLARLAPNQWSPAWFGDLQPEPNGAL